MAGINKQSMAYHNRIETVRQFYRQKTISKKALASHLKLSIPTITNIFNELEKYQIIQSAGTSPGGRGKHQGFWALNPDRQQFLCILVSVTEIASVVVDSQVQPILPIKRLKTMYSGYGELVKGVTAQMAYWKKKFPGLCKAAISCHGVINYDTGDFLWVPLYQDKNGFPFKKKLEENTGFSIRVDNNCNIFALAEKWLGAASGVSDFVWLNLDLGIGGAVVINEEIRRGPAFTGGEIGHTTVQGESGLTCLCGNKGCLTTVAGSYATYVRYQKSVEGQEGSSLSLPDFFSLLKAEDPGALAELRVSACYLARTLFNLVNIVAPQKIYLGGSLSSAGGGLLKLLKEELNQLILMQIQPPDLLELSQLSPEQMLCGAAFLWIEEELNFSLN